MDRAGIMTNPKGGAGNERHSIWPKGVSVLCTASHQCGQNQNNSVIVQQAPRQPPWLRRRGCPVINPLGRVSPGGTAQSAATEQGFGGILTGRVLSDTASL